MGVSKLGGRKDFLISGSLPVRLPNSADSSVPAGNDGGPNSPAAFASPTQRVPPASNSPPAETFRNSRLLFIFSSALSRAALRTAPRFVLEDRWRIRPALFFHREIRPACYPTCDGRIPPHAPWLSTLRSTHPESCPARSRCDRADTGDESAARSLNA